MSFPDFMILISILCAGAVFALPFVMKPKIDPIHATKVKTDLQMLAEAIGMLEKHSRMLAGYPGPNSCVNDLEFNNLETCRLGLKCNDGKYKAWNGPYIKDIPLDPWGRKYYLDNDYYHKGTVSRVLGSMGPNGVQDYDSSSDDIIFVLCSLEAGKG